MELGRNWICFWNFLQNKILKKNNFGSVQKFYFQILTLLSNFILCNIIFFKWIQSHSNMQNQNVPFHWNDSAINIVRDCYRNVFFSIHSHQNVVKINTFLQIVYLSINWYFPTENKFHQKILTSSAWEALWLQVLN